MAVMELDNKLLQQLEDFGFPRARAARALHYSGNTCLEAALDWVIDHENDPDIDEMPLVAVNISIEFPQPSDITEVMKNKAKELRDKVRKKEEEDYEREREKKRIRASKELLEAKQSAEENERKSNLVLLKAEKEDEKRARENILRKLEADKLARRRWLGLPLQGPALKPSQPVTEENGNSLHVKSVEKAEKMRECLRSIRHNHRNDDARVQTAFQTLLVYVSNVAKNPDVEKFRKIRLDNLLFHDRVGSLKGGTEFLELCGFERSEGNELLFLPRNKVDMEALRAAAFQLKSAMTNPFFGLF